LVNTENGSTKRDLQIYLFPVTIIIFNADGIYCLTIHIQNNIMSETMV